MKQTEFKFPSGLFQTRSPMACFEALVELRRIKGGNLPIPSSTQLIIYNEINSFLPYNATMRLLMHLMALPKWDKHFIKLLDDLIKELICALYDRAIVKK